MATVNTGISVQRTWDRPKTHLEKLGSTPTDRFEHTGVPTHGIGNIERCSDPNVGNMPVYGHVPEYNADGSPKMETVTKTLSAQPFNPVARAATTGLAGGAFTLLALGTGPVGWAVAGGVAVAGAILGATTAKGDSVSEKVVQRDIEHPKMTGHTHYTVPVPEFDKVHDEKTGKDKTEVHLAGYVHHFQPTIEKTKVGSYEQPVLEHKRALSGGATALLAAAGGLALGSIVHFFAGEKD